MTNVSLRCDPCSAGERWIALANGIVGEGQALYRAVVDADLEGIVAKHQTDAYHPKLARWHKVLNRAYTHRHGRAEWFRERRGRRSGLPRHPGH